MIEGCDALLEFEGEHFGFFEKFIIGEVDWFNWIELIKLDILIHGDVGVLAGDGIEGEEALRGL